jgi:predicted nucleotidyltransferase
VRVLVFGSLARGDFDPHSDVDLLVVDCPPDRRYAIEGRVEDLMGGLPFDVCYLDELRPDRAAAALAEAIDASDLPEA